SDPRGNLVLMTAFGEINWQPTQTKEGDQCNEEQTVHPLLVYSEMLREHDERAHEAARKLFKEQILPLWSSTT
ncbi:MAG: hypothetical protein JRH20_23730, partial [Deltaproteobacteria bacterium]|nr:hypothetical protein [Deltaproteobacteria bacterium]